MFQVRVDVFGVEAAYSPAAEYLLVRYGALEKLGRIRCWNSVFLVLVSFLNRKMNSRGFWPVLN